VRARTPSHVVVDVDVDFCHGDVDNDAHTKAPAVRQSHVAQPKRHAPSDQFRHARSGTVVRPPHPSQPMLLLETHRWCRRRRRNALHRACLATVVGMPPSTGDIRHCTLAVHASDVAPIARAYCRRRRAHDQGTMHSTRVPVEWMSRRTPHNVVLS
jgi:hypothetical protein